MALVLLHEPFISSPELECESYARVSVAVNATLAAVQKLCATSFDFGLLHPQLFLNWLVSIQELVMAVTMLSFGLVLTLHYFDKFSRSLPLYFAGRWSNDL